MTFTLTITRIASISSIAYTFINQFCTVASKFIIIPTLFITTNTYIQSTFKLKSFMPFCVPCSLVLYISGLTLHSLLAIEIQLNEFMLVKNVDTTKKHFLINQNILFYIVFYHKITMNNWYIFSNI